VKNKITSIPSYPSQLGFLVEDYLSLDYLLQKELTGAFMRIDPGLSYEGAQLALLIGAG
jgi:hypothetical protein